MKIQITLGKTVRNVTDFRSVADVRKLSLWKTLLNRIRVLAGTIKVGITMSALTISGIVLGRWGKDTRQKRTSTWETDDRE